MNQKEFDKKFPGIRKKMTAIITRELKILKMIGFPKYPVCEVSRPIIKNIINLLVELEFT